MVSELIFIVSLIMGPNGYLLISLSSSSASRKYSYSSFMSSGVLISFFWPSIIIEIPCGIEEYSILVRSIGFDGNTYYSL